MKTILLVRHGETEALGKYLAGSMPNCPLNQNGRTQAMKLAVLLSRHPVQAVYTSPLERTVETAAYLAQASGLSPVAINDLAEVNFGAWEGLTFDELNRNPEWNRFNRERSTVRPPNGELMSEVQNRMLKTVEVLKDKEGEDLIVIVSHADPLRTLLVHYLGMSIDHMQRFQIDPAAVSPVRFFDSSSVVLGLNSTGDLTL